MRVLLMMVAMAAMMAAAPKAQAAQGFLNCSSNGYKYNYCAANTQGRVVLMREVSSGNLCRQGSGWGYDNGGIWVDKGCRADFSFGRDDAAFMAALARLDVALRRLAGHASPR